ncbi:isochorismatase domain-containing protein [Balamuthia mandrillaris]
MQAAARKIGRIKPENSVFFLCDVQERFRDLISHMPSVVHVSDLMVKAAPVFKIPVVVTEQYPKAFGRIVPEIDLSGEEVHKFEKTRFSMLTEDVTAFLSQHPQRTSVVLFGIEAHVCVLQTALDLLERNYDVHILADGTSSQRPSDRVMGFERMKQSGAYLTTSDSMLFQLMGDAKYSNFKAISNLIRGDRPDAGISRL